MTRSLTARGMVSAAAFCAIAMVAGQTHLSAQSKPATAKPAPAKVVPKQATTAPSPSITLTGCLEADGRKFMLTHPEGHQAPKGRSWKTGFVTKKTKNVEVVGASSTVKLGDHPGRRVTVVGAIDRDTHLTARSIKQLAASCS